MLTNIKSESNAPFLKSPPLAHKIIFFKKKSTSLSKMGFSIEYSCHTIINIKHEWRLSLQLMTNWSLTSNYRLYSNACLEWLEENRLLLHLGKTLSILFGSKKRLRTSNKLHVVCNGSNIEPDVEVTYLGVNLDQSLSGSSIVNKIVTKCNNKIKFLYRNAKSFDPQTKGMLASALVQCHFDYACSMWFSCVSSTSRKRLQIIQNKLIRFILGISTRSHIGYRELSSSNMLPVEYRVTQLKLNHMFNIVHGSAPEYLKNNIQLDITREPAHNTRSGSFACYIPNVKSFGIKSFFFTGSKLWNSLSHSIQCITDKFIFKKMIKGNLWNRLRSAHIREYIFY